VIFVIFMIGVIGKQLKLSQDKLLKYKHFTKITQITKITVQKLINQFEL